MKAIEMVWILREEEKEAVLALDGPSRYDYFVKKVADENRVWSLWKDGWALTDDGSACPVIPVWPHAQFAKACARGVWKAHEPRHIEMDVWLDQWLPGIQQNNRLVAIFPTANDKGLLVEPRLLASDITKELQNYA